MSKLYGFEPYCVILALTNSHFVRALQKYMNFQISFADFYGRIGNHYPVGKLWVIFI